MMVACFAFMAVGALVVGFMYWSMMSVIDGQIDGAISRDFAAMTATYRRDGYEGLRKIVADSASPQPDAMRVYLLKGPGETLTGNLQQWPAGEPEPGKTADIDVPHAAVAVRVRTLAIGEGVYLLVGRSLLERGNLNTIMAESVVGALLADLLLGIAAASVLARYARRRLGRVNAAAQEVIEGNLSVRVANGDVADEYDDLAGTINAMLDRIQRLVATVKGVTENIAHDLRTPLHRMRGGLEVALMAPRKPEEYRAVLERTIAEADTIIGTFNGILKIGRIKAGALEPAEPVDLAEIMEELADLYQAFAEKNGITLKALSPIGTLIVEGDAHLISQAVANLLDNAIKYSPAGGHVVIAASQTSLGVTLSIADKGPGVPADKRAAILERFARLEETAAKPGYGVGLSFVLAVAEWHGARLTLADNNPGLLASLSFPVPNAAGAV
jgi:signal transduction histidine kinase